MTSDFCKEPGNQCGKTGTVPLVTALLAVYRENGGHFDVTGSKATLHVLSGAFTLQNDRHTVSVA